MRRARVFISCGQRTKKETKIGIAIQEYFHKRGFETYFAERVHSSEALTQNIFRALRRSEYFVFVDFRRDKIGKGKYRGSLFVNQEVAIATFLELQGVGFREKSVTREGILQYHIYNEITFKNGAEIIDALTSETADWDSHSLNEIDIQISNTPSLDVILADDPEQPLTDWYHFHIGNRSNQRHALSVFGYLTRILTVSDGRAFKIPTMELIWSGIGAVETNIMAGTSRDLDAFFIIHGKGRICFHERNVTSTSPSFHLPTLGPGKYMLEYSIISSNFAKSSKWFRLEFGGLPRSLVFVEASEQEVSELSKHTNVAAH